MILVRRSISIKVTEQIDNPIIIVAAIFKVLKYESKYRIKKIVR